MTTLWEVSFECGNKVGGIWTVITTKAKFIQHVFDEYYAIGYYNPKSREVLFEKPPKKFKHIIARLKEKGIIVHYGTWVETGSKIFLVDSSKFYKREINKIKTSFWEKYKIDSLNSGFDYDEPLAWSYAVGEFLKEVFSRDQDKHIVQLHEWLSAGVLLNLHSKTRAKFVFTTHATVLGRATGGDIKGNPDELAKEKKVTAKHLTEKTAAKLSDVFTTVSDITAKECKRVLGREPDVITYNGLDFNTLPNMSQLLSDKILFRKKLLDFVRAYFLPYYALDLSDYPVLYTAGRYEFFNKGYDTFIESLGRVNNHLKKTHSKKWFLVFILVPTGTFGIKDEVIQNFMFYKRLKEIARENIDSLITEIYSGGNIHEDLAQITLDFEKMKKKIETRKNKRPPLCAFELSYPEENDEILAHLKSNGLLNREEDRVKVVYYPVYLNREDELLGMSYKNFLTAASMGVFVSRYEPWGYTPLEAAAYLGTTVMTNKTGFSQAILKKKDAPGLFIATKNSLPKLIESFIEKPKDERLSLEMAAHKFVKEEFSWSKLIHNYLKAYNLALNH